ncbi:MAG: THUMP domain-containing protein [Candidatus Bathyarchaeota archaeon]|uniref:DNA methyltransferase n=2 Tax=Candidatus Bathycorpusculum sp. TaxID=2994959 RepID=UPI002827EC5A|nr:THUMP domain-containing protein [Candidatus Termiticorpusculum sp.]MCL2292130.1 THUMP domain-containing protein [Candidatus Termiticorpusculum sp.]
MAKLFFLLSGENPTLPMSEALAILETEGYTYKTVELMDQVLRLEAPIESVKAVPVRAAFTRVCALELFVSKANYEDIIRVVEETDFKSVLKSGESFVVRINRIKNYADQTINTMDLEIRLGRQILNQNPEAKVNLKQPDKTFIGIITDDKLIFGLKLTEISSKTFSERRPRKKPFFHPSAMPSKLARCMVNLAHGKTEGTMLDPFCGTGSSLIEATYIGCYALGVDAAKRMVIGCRKNLQFFNINAEGLILADARKLPFCKIDCIVTDPPYGRSASTLKSTTKELVHDVLVTAYSLLSEGHRICIASPKTLNISTIGITIGFKHVESHFAYVHSTLTREIAVFEKKRKNRRNIT